MIDHSVYKLLLSLLTAAVIISSLKRITCMHPRRDQHVLLDGQTSATQRRVQPLIIPSETRLGLCGAVASLRLTCSCLRQKPARRLQRLHRLQGDPWKVNDSELGCQGDMGSKTLERDTKLGGIHLRHADGPNAAYSEQTENRICSWFLQSFTESLELL